MSTAQNDRSRGLLSVLCILFTVTASACFTSALPTMRSLISNGIGFVMSLMIAALCLTGLTGRQR